jgi:hypothetical protein
MFDEIVECLVLKCCSSLTFLQINSQSLRRIVLLSDGNMDELSIEDAPRMEG